MIYSEVGFRTVYNQFCCFDMEGILATVAKEHFSSFSNANCVLTYGYIDHNMGLSIEILACGIRDNNQYSFFQPNDSIRTHASISAVSNISFNVVNIDKEHQGLFKKKLLALSAYNVPSDVEYTRSMTFLDSNRNDINVDDIMVHLIKENFEIEGCWVRIEALKEHTFVGRLLNEPNQDFGIHQQEMLEFRVEKNHDGKYLCFCYL